MTDFAIRAENLSKMYRLGARVPYHRFSDFVNGLVTAPVRVARKVFQRPPAQAASGPDHIWALKDVGFEIKQGEVVGVIGRNGAGKSTLLKILARVTEPTDGCAQVRGRVGSLLEVGTGFHPELTGRENIYLNGSILGMTRAEIARKFDQIVDFAEVADFLDTPVKRYSSGMYMRLAFAVAAHLESEILLVDEVLAVGDAAFQKKCIGKIGEVANGGRTVLFVSHNMAAVENLCRRAILIDRGRILFEGDCDRAIELCVADSMQSGVDLRTRTDRRGSGELRVVSIELRNQAGRRIDTIASGSDVDVYLHYEGRTTPLPRQVITSIAVHTTFGVPVFLQHNRMTRDSFGDLPKTGAFVCAIKRIPLPAGTYTISFSVMRPTTDYIDAIKNAANLQVTAGDFFGSGEVPPISHGVCLVDADWRLAPAS